MTSGYCDESNRYSCLEYNKDNCGLLYSSSIQASWCSIKDPSSWPPVYQVGGATWLWPEGRTRGGGGGG